MVLCALIFGGCSAPDQAEYDAKVPGKALGAFQITGRIRADECGADWLGAPDPWRFEVRLSRFHDDLYWLNGREAIVGEIDEDAETFHFSTRVDVRVGDSRQPCTVSRYDQAEGSVGFDGEDVVSLEGKLKFTYRSKNDLECHEIVGVPGGVTNLPCVLEYRISGKRTSAAP